MQQFLLMFLDWIVVFSFFFVVERQNKTKEVESQKYMLYVATYIICIPFVYVMYIFAESNNRFCISLLY